MGSRYCCFSLISPGPASFAVVTVRTRPGTPAVAWRGRITRRSRQARKARILARHIARAGRRWPLALSAEVKDAYFDLYYILRASETVTKNKELLEKFAKIAEAGFAVGKGIQQDVLKAQVEVSRLIDQLTVLELRRHTAEARLNSLLFREPETPVGRPEEVRPRDFPYGLAELNELALTSYPTLKAQRRRIDREQYGVELAEKDFYPDFSVGLTYFNRPGMPEMYGVNVGVKIPLYFWQKQRPAVAEATAGAAAEKQRLENITTLLFFHIKDRYLAATTAERLVKLYGTTIIPQSSLALESAILRAELLRTIIERRKSYRGAGAVGRSHAEALTEFSRRARTESFNQALTQPYQKDPKGPERRNKQTNSK